MTMWKLRVRLIPYIGPTMHYATLPFSFSRNHSAVLEAAQTYCRYILAYLFYIVDRSSVLRIFIKIWHIGKVDGFACE